MNVLIACEYSGRVRDAFIAQGHNAMSCDLEPTENEGPHYQGSVLDILDDGWDMMIAHPPCTYLCSANPGLWYDRARWQAMNDAADFFELLYNAPIRRVCVENPAGIMSQWFRKPDQYIHPWWFGEPYTKRTGLWLRGLSPLSPTDRVEPLGPWVDGGGRRGGVCNVKDRSRTFVGIANAMASQWSQ